MLLLTRARVPSSLLPQALVPAGLDPVEPLVSCDILIDGESIRAVGPVGSFPTSATAVHDAAEAVVFPGMVDCHVHLDKTHTWHRAPNRTSTFWDALATLAKDKDHWTREDLLHRAGFALKTAWAHGTRLIRTHVDIGHTWGEVSHATMAELRTEWKGRIELQTVPLCGLDLYTEPNGERIADIALKHGASALGGWSVMTSHLPKTLDHLMALAAERKVPLDFHVDENGDPNSEVLRLVAEAVLRNQFPHPVVCGHCCSLSVQAPERRRSTIDLLKEAKIRIVSLPLCNQYLQDRRGAEFPRSPHWRGLAPLHDLWDAGIPVACASDNVRDAFYAWGDYDAAEVYTQSVRMAHLDTRLADSPMVVTKTAADMIGAPTFGRIAPGARASLVLFPTPSLSGLLSRPMAGRVLIDHERVHTPELPDYRSL